MRRDGTTYEIKVENPHNRSRGVARIEIDGTAVAPGSGPISLAKNDGTHRVLVVLGDDAAMTKAAQ